MGKETRRKNKMTSSQPTKVGSFQTKEVKFEREKYQYSKINSNHGRWILNFGLKHIQAIDGGKVVDEWTLWKHSFYFHYKKDMDKFIKERLVKLSSIPPKDKSLGILEVNL